MTLSVVRAARTRVRSRHAVFREVEIRVGGAGPRVVDLGFFGGCLILSETHAVGAV